MISISAPFKYTVTCCHYRVTVLPTLLLLGTIIASFVSLVIAVKYFPGEQLVFAVPTLVVVIVGCSYAIWPFIEQVQKLPTTEKREAKASYTVVHEISRPLAVSHNEWRPTRGPIVDGFAIQPVYRPENYV